VLNRSNETINAGRTNSRGVTRQNFTQKQRGAHFADPKDYA
jgi:hypothetical protein